MSEEFKLGRAQRKRETRKSVLVAERIAKTAITLGGIGTIIAVSLIFVFLAWVVMPMFQSAPGAKVDSFSATAEEPWAMGIDEDRLISWTLHRDGTLELHDLGRGVAIAGIDQPFEDGAPTAISKVKANSDALDELEKQIETDEGRRIMFSGDSVVFGFADGTVRSGMILFGKQFFEQEEEAPEEIRGLKRGEWEVHDGGIFTRTSVGQLRRTSLEVFLEEPLSTGTDSPVAELDHTLAPLGLYLTILQENGSLRVSRERSKKNLLTGKITKSLRNAVLREPDHPGTPPRFIGIGGLGQHVYTAWEDGTLEHWDLSEWSAPKLYEYPEPLDLLTRDDATITTFGFVAGKKTLVIGDDQGGVSTWFPAREEDDDGSPPLLMLSKSWEATGSPVLATVASPRSRLLTVSHADGLVRVFQASLGQLVLETEAGEPLSPVLVAPREDALIGRGRESLWTFEVDFKYPEATLASLFSPVHYEGFREEKHSWQSSSASDDFEPKLGLVPLVFGTLKATFYSLLFGAPLAFLAAIFTSEFLAARMRTGIKSTVELMASLPSVVLGFIAALVIAPFVQGVLATVLACFLTIPATLLGGAFLWQMLPGDRMVRWSGWQRFLAICATLPIGVLLAMVVGPYLIEGLFFSGDLLGWLSGEGTSTTGGWLFLLLPLSALIVAIGSAFFGFKLRDKQTEWTRQKLARFQALKFAAGFGITIVLALVLGLALNGIGVDPRGGLMDTYIQRNAMIVGFAMGFAIVPIIYTLSEDALSEVPADLREGSLGAGATQWQTAVRIVIPYAMSGLFSALMIGLGRAVGETMIVLMAAGNTAIMDWNVFNGFRTLAANIAYEMPEAVVGSAHYRTLFLAALVLFAMTFVLNTAAELARRHFRVRTNAL